jgi:RES domain-containing protein
VRIWRIAPAGHPPLDGEGARRYGSRWTPKGLPVVYASATLSLAALERFVHTDPDLDVPDLIAIAIDVAPRIKTERMAASALPSDWRSYPAPEFLARLGEVWAANARSAILIVPSAIIPSEDNFILNPSHRDFGRLKIGPPEPFAFDPRMRRRLR